MTSKAIYNLYERIDSMTNTANQMLKEVERNNAIIKLLEKAEEEEKKELEIESFIKVIKDQVKSYEDQYKRLITMIENTKKVVTKYEDDSDSYSEIIDDLLTSFGYEKADPDKNPDLALKD